MGSSPSALLDAVLFAAVALALAKYSRFAAVAGFALFLVEKIYTVVLTGSILGIGVLAVVILFGFLNGIRGAFAYQKLLAYSRLPERDSNQTPLSCGTAHRGPQRISFPPFLDSTASPEYASQMFSQGRI